MGHPTGIPNVDLHYNEDLLGRIGVVASSMGRFGSVKLVSSLEHLVSERFGVGHAT